MKMDNEILDNQKFALVCKALGHPARVEIVKHLLKIDNCVCGKIVEILPLAQSTVSQHLKILKHSGLVKGEIDGQRSCYCIDHRVWGAFKRTVDMLYLYEKEKPCL